MRSSKYVAARPDGPTDALVESISFRETRFYVKRVLTTYQTYHLLYDGGPAFADWAGFADRAVP